ncbi:hypothetical protein [Kineococcus radiotolerans]|uniref:Secreted protein n=1 Tax=Kineococcus radiotolerans (strain ATCC BAA-149 / DSM 14245 / SRS30216) TaxID=266940 RepID=A6WCQ2_KINRD|nr:hypothetical protein [Kineococcus radiotolerans]ABS04591.1 hypothetical protein Krad_3127 [Kineococcus radiotolerans SRS30216 = ATCC BAA-149]
MSRNRVLLTAAACAVAALTGACSGAATDTTTAVEPPAASATSAAVPPTGVPAGFEGDAAVTAVHAYLREQALAVNAGVADPARLPGFTATLTPAGQEWAVPLLAANLGDWMPGPYPVGVLASTRVGDDRVELALCLQDRGWQVERSTGRALNAPHHATARAVVLRVGERWLVDDVAADGGECTAADVVEERF